MYEKTKKRKWYKVNDLCRLFDTYPSTVHRWEQQGKIQSIRSPSGYRLFKPEDVHAILDGIHHSKEKQKAKIIYCRVSSKHQLDDLQRQIDFLKSKFPDHELVQDVASGINWKRKGLRSILERAMSGNVQEVVVAHKDRLCRFGFELIEWILNKCDSKIIVLEDSNIQSGEQELAQDLLSVITIFNCRNMGRRRYSNRSECNNSNLLQQQEPEESS